MTLQGNGGGTWDCNLLHWPWRLGSSAASCLSPCGYLGCRGVSCHAGACLGVHAELWCPVSASFCALVVGVTWMDPRACVLKC